MSRELRIDVGETPGTVWDSEVTLGKPQALFGIPNYGWGDFLEILERWIMNIQKPLGKSFGVLYIFHKPNVIWKQCEAMTEGGNHADAV